MTGQEAIEYIHSFQWEKHEPGLHRIRELLRGLGDPQKDLKFVHVAGTNGKGSTCAMLAAVLKEAGYRVGLNTSPYIVTFHERIQVNGQLITNQELAELVEKVQPVAESMREHPTEFELITAIAMLYFKEQNCDIVVLEVGLGGELDASNVIDCPEVAVLTAMGLDHTAILGPTLTHVAQAKAGIIKAGGAVVSYGGAPEADEVFRIVAEQKHAVLCEVDFSRLRKIRSDLTGTEFEFVPYSSLRLALTGVYQVYNAATAITTIEVLKEKGWNISSESIIRGLAETCWPGRFEVLRKAPLFILDGAHNAHGMRAATESLRAILPQQKVVAVLGVLADKDVEEMLDLLVPLTEMAFVIRPDSPRALSAEALCEKLCRRGVEATACDTVDVAVAAAASTGKPVCALGSLYMSGAVKAAISGR